MQNNNINSMDHVLTPISLVILLTAFITLNQIGVLVGILAGLTAIAVNVKNFLKK